MLETYGESSLCCDSHFAGVTLLHMNIKHISHLNSPYLTRALIQSDLDLASNMGGCQCFSVGNLRLSRLSWGLIV